MIVEFNIFSGLSLSPLFTGRLSRSSLISFLLLYHDDDDDDLLANLDQVMLNIITNKNVGVCRKKGVMIFANIIL